MNNRKQLGRAGYSLVEVTLALLVVAIGLTATFALFPEGLRATRAAVDDTEIAMFAEYVFTSMDLAAGKYGADWDIADTDEFVSLMLSTRVSATNFELNTTSGNSSQTFRWYPDYFGLSAGSFEASNFDDYWTSAFTYTLQLELSAWKGYGSGVTKYAILKVWPGESKGRPEDARVFYREILPIR